MLIRNNSLSGTADIKSFQASSLEPEPPGLALRAQVHPTPASLAVQEPGKAVVDVRTPQIRSRTGSWKDRLLLRGPTNLPLRAKLPSRKSHKAIPIPPMKGLNAAPFSFFFTTLDDNDLWR